MKTFKIIALLAISIALLSCNNKEAKSNSDVIATVFGNEILNSEFNTEVKRFKDSFVPEDKELTEDEELRIKKQVLESLIQKKIYTTEMDKLEIKDDQDMVKKQYSQLLMQYGSKEALENAIASSGFTVDELMKEFTFQTRVNNLTKYVQDLDIEVDPKEVRSYYEENKERVFLKHGSVTARHILIKTNEDKDKALADINSIKNKITNGLDFSEAAKEYSQGPSGENGGSLGEFKKGQMVKEFEEVAFTQEVGVVSEPVLTQFGYHLILVDKRVEETVAEFEEAENFIKQQLKKESYFEDLEKRANITKPEWAEGEKL